ncbi:MAG: head-tail connector protein [Bauldia sp.]
MLRPVLITAPALAPVSLAEAKAHLRVDHPDDDTLIGNLVDAATAHLDGRAGVLGRCMVNQEWRIDLADFNSVCLRLPFCDVSGVVIKYDDAAEAEQTLAASNYRLLEDARSSYLEFTDGFAAPTVFDKPNAVRITLVAGFGASAADVPAALRLAIKQLVAHWYGSREAVSVGNIGSELPLTVAALIQPYRRVGI